MSKEKTPRFVLSRSRVRDQYRKLEPLADMISYSSKTNQEVAKILEKDTDCMFSVHFENELKHLKNHSRVIFLAQAWDEEQIKRLVSKGIKWFIVDNETDLDTLLKFLEKSSEKVNLFLRMKLAERTLRTERYFVFGMPSKTVNKRVQQLRGHPRIGELGIHFHRKTQNMSEWDLKHEMELVLEEETLATISWVNMGGGFPCEYANTNMKVLDGILSRVQEFREWLSGRNVKLILEPGRFIAAPAVRLVARIIGIHENNIIVDASVYNSDMDAIVVPVKLLVEGELQKGEGKQYVIKGKTPCSMDLFRYRVYLEDPKVGDEIVFLNAGAYNFTTDFCDLEKIDTFIVD